MARTMSAVGVGAAMALAVALAAGCATETAATMPPGEVPPCEGEACGLLTQDEHEAMLGELGVDLTPDAPVDPSGDVLPDDHHPLGSRVRNLSRIDELFFAGFRVGEGDALERLGVLDDGSAAHVRLAGESGDPWAGSPRKAIAADLDGDGIDEIIYVAVVDSDAGETLLLARVARRTADGLELGPQAAVATFARSPLDLSRLLHGYAQLDLVAADLDGDGRDHVLVAVGGELLQLEHEGSAFRVLDQRSFSDPGGDDAAAVYVRLAAGDLELNGRDQVVIVHSAFFSASRSIAQYSVVAGDLRTEIASGPVQRTSGGLLQLVTASPEIAELDGDGVPEVVFAGRAYGGTVGDAVDAMVVLLMNGPKHPLPYAFRATDYRDPGHLYAIYPLAAADLYGDRTDELLVGRSILRLAEGALVLVRGGLTTPAVHDGAIAGDFTGDEREDFVVVYGTGDTGDAAAYRLYGLEVIHVDDAFTLRETAVAAPAAITGYPVLALANVDEDSAVVRFVGHELQFGDPTVIAAIAAPPSFAGGGQSDGETVFGRSRESEVQEEVSLGFSVSLSLGLELEDPITQAEVSAHRTWELSLGWTTSHTRTVERTVAFATGPNEDKVVFAAVPYDVYVYETLHSPNPAAIGTRAAVAVPRPPQILGVARQFFNERVRGRVAPIDERVLGHVVGDPFSYPQIAARDSRILAGDCLYSQAVTVGVGTGATTVTVSRSEGVGEGMSRDRETTRTAGGGIGGFVAEVSYGLEFGITTEVTNTEGTFYEGKVGDISTERIDELGLYQFGLFAYPQAHGGAEMLVVNYWVEE